VETSALYPGLVMHRRLTPRRHRFRYRVFAMLIDLADLPALDSNLTLFAWNRRGVFSFHDRDHGDGGPPGPWLDGLLASRGIAADGPRRVLCYPRIFGYVFNPLSVWFCHDGCDALKAIVYEVHNTYGARHSYVFETADGAPRHDCAKDFFVSPFLSNDCRYHFRIRPPAAGVTIAIHEEEAGTPVLDAVFTGKRRALSDGALFRMLFAYPLMTLKVVVAIHFEAVRLMLKGVRRHVPAPANTPLG
jgi:DUF1365 family protein